MQLQWHCVSKNRSLNWVDPSCLVEAACNKAIEDTIHLTCPQLDLRCAFLQHEHKLPFSQITVSFCLSCWTATGSTQRCVLVLQASHVILKALDISLQPFSKGCILLSLHKQAALCYRGQAFKMLLLNTDS